MSLKRSLEPEGGNESEHSISSEDFSNLMEMLVPGPSETLQREVENSIRKLQDLPDELKSKVWTAENLLKKTKSTDRIYTKDNDPDVLKVLFALVPAERLKDIKKKGPQKKTPEVKEDGQPVQKKRKVDIRGTIDCMRMDQSFKGVEEKNSHENRLLEMVNACLRPEEVEKKVWLGNPAFSYSTLHENGGQINFGILFMSLVFKELLRQSHEKNKNSLMAGPNAYVGEEGMTLHEVIVSSPQLADRFPIGKRGDLGQMVQWDIRHPHGGVVMTKEEFNHRHYKKKHDYSEHYFMVYRPEELATVHKCLTEKLNDER
jgi:hypothetical protein